MATLFLPLVLSPPTYCAPIVGDNLVVIERRVHVAPCTGGHRSLQSIIWSCLSTIFLCTWVAVHPNIPRHNEKESSIIKQRIYLLLAGLIAPEILVLVAARQYYSVKRNCTLFARRNIPLTRTQAHFIQMGGFMLYQNSEPLGLLSGRMILGMLRGNDIYYSEIRVSRSHVSLSMPTDEEIWDRSKGGWISKAWAASQVSWFIFQCVTRWAYGLSVTELEVATLCLAALNSILYFLWWSKPVDIRIRQPVVWTVCGPREETNFMLSVKLRSFGKDKPPDIHSVWQLPLYSARYVASIATFFGREYRFIPVAGMMSYFIGCTEISDNFYQVQVLALSGGVATVFGALHALAWNAKFLTEFERVTWQACTIFTASVPILPVVWRLNFNRAIDKIEKGRDAVEPTYSVFVKRLYFCLIPFYAIARVLIFAVAFASLRAFQIDGRLEVTSVNYIPHI